ncbi:hypothetical protein ABPG72_012895 [Tetrahymena utriculariae]
MGQQTSADKQQSKVLYSVPVSLNSVSQSSIYRNPQSTENLINTFDPNILTLKDAFLSSAKQYENNNFLGKKDPSKNEYKWWTYKQILKMSEKVGSAITDKCLFNQSEDLNTVGIFAKNCLEWIVIEYACILYNYVIVAVQNNAISHIVNECNLETIFCSEELIPQIMDNDNVKTIVCFSNSDQFNESYYYQLMLKGKQLIFFKDLLLQEQIHPYVNIKPSSIYTICYTSGTTTTTPKGAMITHANCISSLTPFKVAKDQQLKINQTDIYYSVLPLSHIYERDVCQNMMVNGASIGFASKDLASQKLDLEILQPTIYCSVPRLYNRVYQSIKDKIQNFDQGLYKKFFEYALDFKISSLCSSGENYKNPIFDTLIFNKLKQTFGGRTRVLICGGAPLNDKVLNFLQAVLCVPIIQGYGQSESTGVALSTEIEDNYHGTVGGPKCNMEFKLIDCPELNYSCMNQDLNGKSKPRGEILLRGGKVFKGYFKDRSATKKAIDKEGWLHTGDIGELQQNGSLKIIDRRNNIFKLPIGEYVSPEKIEGIYSIHPAISEIFIYGATDKNYLVAIIVPEFSYIQNKLSLENIDQCSAEYIELVKRNPIIQTTISQALQEGDKELIPFERVNQFRLESNSFQTLNLLTSTGKIQRSLCAQYFKTQIDEMYQFHEVL